MQLEFGGISKDELDRMAYEIGKLPAGDMVVTSQPYYNKWHCEKTEVEKT